MNTLSSNPILEFNPNQMSEVRKLFGYDDLNRLQQDINLLQNWIKKQPHHAVKEYDEGYLERHLICSKGSIERAKKHIDKLCTLRGLMPEYLGNFDIENEFNNTLNVISICVLPKPTPDNYRIVYSNYHNADATLFDLIHTLRYLLLVVEYLHRHDYNAGIEIVCDITNITLGILSQFNPVVIANTLMIITEALGLRVKGIHYISRSNFIDIVLKMLKQALSNKLVSRLHIHESYEAMFNFIPKEILPKDVGGDLSTTIKEIREKNFRELSSPDFVKNVKFMEGAVTDESKRINSKFNEDYSGMPGSFKFLNVD